MKIKVFACLILIVLMMNNSKAQGLETVPEVDLKKYAGKWYEIASYPAWFAKNCHCTTANYTLSDKGYVVVENSCHKKSASGRISYVKGRAYPVENSGNAKLRVQFFWPFKGNYWIIDLADDYSYAVVSEPRRKYLWILCRQPQMDEKIYRGILARLQVKGFDLTKLHKTEQA